MTQEANFSSDLYKVGSNFIVGLSGTELRDDEAKLLAALQPAGIILFGTNIDATSPNWVEQLINLIADTRSACGREGLLVSIDHEGGPVHRFPGRVTHFPAAQLWPDLAFDVGAAMGRELRALGMNLDFAPVLDVITNPQNKVIGRRAFGSNPAEVAQAAIRFRDGLESQGVIACGKHFPGHGGTIADSHFELPVLDRSVSELEACELIPFRRLIENGLQLMMTAHVLYPQIDRDYPATLSKTIIQSLLRTRCGFTGTVISDALEMHALGSFSKKQVAVTALNAGVDLLLAAQPKGREALADALELAHGLLEALDSNELTEPALVESHRRIQRLLNYGKELRQRTRNSEYSAALLGCDAHQELAARIAVREA